MGFWQVFCGGGLVGYYGRLCLVSITLIGFWEVCGSGDSHRCSRTINTGNIIVGGKKA